MKRIFIKALDKRFKWKFVRALDWPKDKYLQVKKIHKDQIEGILLDKGKIHANHWLCFVPWIPEYGTDHDFGFEMLE